MKASDIASLERYCRCTSCRGTGYTNELRCQAMKSPMYRKPTQCKAPAKPGSNYCGIHKNKEEKK